MAYTPCALDSVMNNIQENCGSPAMDGVKVLGVAIARNDITAAPFGATQSTANCVAAITLKAAAQTIAIEAGGENAWADSGSELDPATKKHTKNANFVAADYGAEISSEVLDPMVKDRDGFVVILQRKDVRGMGSFVIVGLEKGATVSAMTQNLTDAPTSGCASLVLTETGANKAEVNLFDTDYTTSKAEFDRLLALAY